MLVLFPMASFRNTALQKTNSLGVYHCYERKYYWAMYNSVINKNSD